MAARLAAYAAGAALAGVVGGCSSPFDAPRDAPRSIISSLPADTDAAPPSVFRRDEAGAAEDAPALTGDVSPDRFVRYALYHSPRVEAAYQRWRAAAERVPQARALPDPRLNVGFFLDEVETRTGPQRARVGVRQSFPWPGVLRGRADAATLSARAAWRRFEAACLGVTERVVHSLHALAYLDAATRITEENLALLASFESVVRTRYRVGAGSHPELIRVQLELGELEDRLVRLRAMRPAYVAELNAVLHRSAEAVVAPLGRLPGRLVSVDGGVLAETARRANPGLLALDDRTEAQRTLAEVARREGRPGFTVGLDYTVTDDAVDPSIAESGDDPVFLSLGVRLPVDRGKYSAAVREAVARRLAAGHERADEAARLDAAVRRAWFEHTDADRRVKLYERALIPKAQASLRASLAGFRAGEAGLLDLLDTERSLLEFALAAERARADRGQALARLDRLAGEPVPTEPETPTETQTHEVKP